MKQRVYIKVILKQDGKVLLILPSGRHDKGRALYELPGTRVLPGQHPLDSLRNYMADHLNIELETVQLDDVLSNIRALPEPSQTITLVYQASVAAYARKIKLSPSIEKYVWIELKKIQLDKVTEDTALALQLKSASYRKEELSYKEQLHVAKTTPHSYLVIYTDGGSRGNPGPSATGFVILDESENYLYEGGSYLGITTNNQAEYQAVLQAMEKAKEMGARQIDFRLDSLLVVNQLSGIYQIKNRDLWPIFERIKQLSGHFDKVSYRHVKREYNRLADGMVNKVLDEHKL